MFPNIFYKVSIIHTPNPDTDNIDIRESDDVINIDIDYALDINYEHLANCRIKMEIKNSVSMDDNALQERSIN